MENENSEEVVGIDFDALIPAELRDAVKEMGILDEPVTPVQAQPQVQAQAQTPAQPQTPAAPATPNIADVPLTDDLIAKMAAGNFEEALTAQPVVEEEEAPDWVNEEEYKALSKRLSNYGADTKMIDTLLKKVVDSHTVNSGRLLQGIRAELDKTIKEKELRETDNHRLKQLERAVRFDHLPTTNEKFTHPMNNIARSMHDILTREAVPLSVKDIVSAKNRTEFNAMLSKHRLEDEDITKLSNGWKQYKDIELSYLTERDAAIKDLNKALTVSISEDTANKVFLNRFSDKIKNKEDYGYLAEAVSKGVETNPKAAEVIDRARSNLINFIDAINKSADVAHDDNFINGLTDFMIDASHNTYIKEQHKTLVEQNKTLGDAFKNLFQQYKQLASGAKGITGKPGQVVINGKAKEDHTSDAEDYKKFLSGKMDFSELINKGS